MKKITLNVNDDGSIDIQSDDGQTGSCPTIDGVQDALKQMSGEATAEPGAEMEAPEAEGAEGPEIEMEMSPEDAQGIADYMDGSKFAKPRRRGQPAPMQAKPMQ